MQKITFRDPFGVMSGIKSWTCPKCDGHHFYSSIKDDGTVVRICNGNEVPNTQGLQYKPPCGWREVRPHNIKHDIDLLNSFFSFNRDPLRAKGAILT